MASPAPVPAPPPAAPSTPVQVAAAEAVGRSNPLASTLGAAKKGAAFFESGLANALAHARELGKEAQAPGPEGPQVDVSDQHLYADGAVFGKPKSTAYHDTVWQTDPPRMLRYRPGVLHSYGWIPGLIPRNFKGTVLRDPHTWLQIFSSWVWMLFIRNTGLYSALRDQKAFVLFFGTPYMTAILNLCMTITFVLGLFVTLVVNRWWDIRVNYGVARSLSIELAYIVSTNLRATKGPSGESPQRKALSGAQNAAARSEVVRYLNFAHLLLVVDAQKAEKGDFSESPDKRLGRFLRRTIARVPVLRQVLALEAGLEGGLSGLGDVMGNPRQLLRSLQAVSAGIVSGVLGAVNDVGSAVKSLASGQGLQMDDLGLEEQQKAMERQRRQRSAATEADFQQFYVMGLVTPDEWALIKAAEKDGVPSWRTVYTWVASLVADAVAEGRMDERVATAGGMQAMCMEIRNAGGRVFTMMNTQLPFTYVHLVSFVCHVYLFVLATYMGFVLAVGIPGINWQIEVNDADRTAHWSGNLYSHGTQNGGKEGGGPLLSLLIFFIVAYANIIIQGLLSMHGLLENPFGTHPCKFPLRAYNIDHIRQTRAMLRDPHEREPGTIRNIFSPPQPPPQASGADPAAAPAPAPAQAGPEGAASQGLSDDGQSKGIHFVQQKESQMHTDVQAPSSNASIM